MRVTDYLSLPSSERFSRVQDFQCQNQDSPKQTRMVGHPVCLLQEEPRAGTWFSHVPQTELCCFSAYIYQQPEI